MVNEIDRPGGTDMSDMEDVNVNFKPLYTK